MCMLGMNDLSILKRENRRGQRELKKRRPQRTVVAKEADYSVVPQSCQIEGISDKEGYPAYG